MKNPWIKWVGLTILFLAIIAVAALEAWVEIQAHRAPDQLQAVAVGETDSAGGSKSVQARRRTVLEVKAENGRIHCLEADGLSSGSWSFRTELCP